MTAVTEQRLGLAELESAAQRFRVADDRRRHRSTVVDEGTLRGIRERLVRQGGSDAVDALDRLSTTERALLAHREREL